jgi:hypothetical protein
VAEQLSGKMVDEIMRNVVSPPEDPGHHIDLRFLDDLPEDQRKQARMQIGLEIFIRNAAAAARRLSLKNTPDLILDPRQSAMFDALTRNFSAQQQPQGLGMMDLPLQEFQGRVRPGVRPIAQQPVSIFDLLLP